MKVLCTVLLFLFFTSSLHAQNTLWGTVKRGGLHNYGFLYKTDSIGNNLVVMHHFDSIHSGKNPGPLMQASNGKLYGMTLQGGHGVVQLVGGPTGFYYTQGGTLFEYDPVIDSLKVLKHFNSTDPQYPTNFYNPSELKLLEASPGVLWAVLTLRQNNNGLVAPLNEYIVSYNTLTSNMTHVATVPSWYTPSKPDPQYTSITGVLYKAADGFVYGTTSGYSSCATLHALSNGSVIRIDPATNTFSFIKPFDCMSYADGWLPDGNFEEVNGKFYGRTYHGGPNMVYPTFLGYGLIYEYDPAANTYTKKYDFAGGAMGGNLNGYHVKAHNGKLYGTTFRGSTNINDPNGSGVLYEYDPATNIYSKKHDFGALAFSIHDVGPYGALWLSAHSGKLYGTTALGIFEYDIATNQARPAARYSMAGYNALATPLIEICMKPTYRLKAQPNYTLCAGSFFSHVLQSVNSDAYVWKHNGITDVSQTSGTLQFNQISVADGGTWVCEMTNTCGTTTAQTISITVNAAGGAVLTSTVSPAGHLHICPGSSLTLNGNVDGTWNTGSTAPSLVVSAPGVYQVTNTNACGHTLSNIVLVDTIATPVIPIITFTTSGTYNSPILSQSACPGDSAVLLGNYPGGVWSSGETTPAIYVKDVTPRYITVNNGCRAVLSATAQLAFIAIQVPSVTAIGSRTICAGDSIRLVASGGSSNGYNWYNDNGSTNSYVGYGSQFYAKQSGNYYIRQNPYCGPVYSQTIHVDASGTAVGPALITALGSTVICQGSSVVLQSNYASCTWNTGATTQTVLATGAGPYTVTNYNSCSSMTSAAMSLSVIPAPIVNYTEANSAVCVTTGAYNLTAASPTGGSYAGNGVSGNTFSPVLAGAGTHTVTYTYLHAGTGCSGSAMQQITVEGNPLLTAAPSTVFCQGSSTVLFQDTPNGIWNSTGLPGLFIVVTQAGDYYVSKINSCGVPVSSNTLHIVSKPSPTITVSGTTAMCAGQQVTLSAHGGTSYTWTPGGISNLITVSPGVTTSYTLAGAGSNGCFGYAVETVTVYALPSISTTNTSVCLGSPVSLSANGALTYTWSTSQTGASITVTPTANTVYQVTGTDSYSCVNTATAGVTVNPLPAAPVITLTGNILSSSPAASYQWYLNGGIIAGATSQTYAPVQNGNYTVVIDDQNGCSATSASHSILDTGLSDWQAGSGEMQVYPNPSTGNFTVKTPFSEYELRIVDALGRTIARETGSFSTEFSIGENGIYMIHLLAKGRVYTQKLLITIH